MILLSATKAIRLAAAEQLLLISSTQQHPKQQQTSTTTTTATATSSTPMLNYFLSMLFSVLQTTAREHAKNSHEFFQLLCRLLNFATTSSCALPSAETLLTNEINWLKKARVKYLNRK